MQLRMNTANKDQIKNAWAFAVDKDHAGRRVRVGNAWRHLNHSVITACSKEAKNLGIRAGMHYEDARTLLPELKVLVYGRH
ncbi:MAG TPA: hypothetical protein VM124_02265 [Candidatus Limnocylindrales bacterium]|nr:hypothetical protein [Candidatus Limnocylindrales bacterium]